MFQNRSRRRRHVVPVAGGPARRGRRHRVNECPERHPVPAATGKLRGRASDRRVGRAGAPRATGTVQLVGHADFSGCGDTYLFDTQIRPVGALAGKTAGPTLAGQRRPCRLAADSCPVPCAALFWRGGGGLRHLGRPAVLFDALESGPATDIRLSEPSQLQRTVVRGDHHGHLRHQTGLTPGRTVSPALCTTGRRRTGRVVAGHSDLGTADGFVHQRAGRDDHLGPVAGPAILRAETARRVSLMPRWDCCSPTSRLAAC